MTSLQELYRIGRGPSSSHTMAPSAAAEIFYKRVPNAAEYSVTLYGSLAATGKGHFTDQALLSVLPPERTKIIWAPETILKEHPNGMLFYAKDAQKNIIEKWKVFSIGGGALSEDGRTATIPDCYDFKTMQEILDECLQRGIPFWQIVEEIEGLEYLETVYSTMLSCIENGLCKDGVLPGGLQLGRKARSVYLKTQSLRPELRRTGLLAAYAYAASEENASLGIVVTAPTCGSCAVVPAVLRYLQESCNCTKIEMVRSLAVAGLFGNIIKRNGSISGAEVGCQGEIGSACAMASAAAAYLLGGTIRQCEYAAEIGLEHFLGLTCDPVMGLVQIPCIERNCIAANHAITAAEIALISDGHHLISFDDAVMAMLKTGHDLPSLYKETSLGGLAGIMHQKVTNIIDKTQNN